MKPEIRMTKAGRADVAVMAVGGIPGDKERGDKEQTFNVQRSN